MVVAAGREKAEAAVPFVELEAVLGAGDGADAVQRQGEPGSQGADLGAVLERGGKQQFVVVAARGTGPESTCGVAAGRDQRIKRQGGADAGLFEDVIEIAEEAVGDVEHGAGQAAQGEAEFNPRLRAVQGGKAVVAIGGGEADFAAQVGKAQCGPAGRT